MVGTGVYRYWVRALDTCTSGTDPYGYTNHNQGGFIGPFEEAYT